jgi:hypothetical protein
VHYKGTISGFGQNTTQKIDLADVSFSSAATKTLAAGVLTVDDHAGHAAHIKFAGSLTLAKFAFQDDGHGGTLIGYSPAVTARAWRPVPCSASTSPQAWRRRSAAPRATHGRTPKQTTCRSRLTDPSANPGGGGQFCRTVS